MSAASNPDDYAQLAKDGVISAALGGGAAISRILLNPEPVSMGWVIRRTVSSAGIAVLAGYALQEHVASLSLRFACIGLAGATAPEIMEGAIRWVQARINSEVGKARKKPNAKRKPKKRR
jgi:hypothetical protein